MFVACNHQTFKRCICRPDSFNRLCHGTACLARANHDGAATTRRSRRLWQEAGSIFKRQGAGHRGVKKVLKKRARLRDRRWGEIGEICV